jgi:large subunit ribosomal protein L1
MAKRSKKYVDALKKFEATKEYSLEEAVRILKEIKYTKFDETVDLTVNLGVDPKHADQMVRGVVSLPHGVGAEVRVICFAEGDLATEAKEAGADVVGSKDLMERIQQEGWLDFDKVVAAPDMMKYVGRLGKILGPRGLMPNPKVGTVTREVGKVVADLKAGQLEYRVDKFGIIHIKGGKTSFEVKEIYENLVVIINALDKAKPAVAKGNYLQRITVSSTMSPGIRVEVAGIRNDLDAARKAHLIA